ncbi:MAG: bifunctional hydroxymethylpyrimidine kinase/phosphomethylpyrimidine kinase [Acidimicrobiia bacterium]
MSPVVRPHRALSIGGSDSSGGAGVQADLKTFERHRVWGLSAVVAVTAQDTTGLVVFETVSPGLLRQQIVRVVTDVGVTSAKTGMLATGDHVAAVARAVSDYRITPLVIDPVMAASVGGRLLSPDGVDALRQELVPLAALVTPNLGEAAVLAGGGDVSDRPGMRAAALEIRARGVSAVLVTGGHLEGPAADLLLLEDEEIWLAEERLAAGHTHGTGCVLSAAVAARLARGESVLAAVRGAKRFVTAAIAAGFPLGAGVGPVDPGAVPPELC